jgi:hypothetical protein
MIKRMVCSHRYDTDQINPRGRHRAEIIELVSMGASPTFARSPSARACSIASGVGSVSFGKLDFLFRQ